MFSVVATTRNNSHVTVTFFIRPSARTPELQRVLRNGTSEAPRPLTVLFFAGAVHEVVYGGLTMWRVWFAWGLSDLTQIKLFTFQCAIYYCTCTYNLYLPCGTKFLRVLMFAVFPAIRQNTFPRITITANIFPAKIYSRVNILQLKFATQKYSTKKSCLFDRNSSLSFRNNEIMVYCLKICVSITRAQEKRKYYQCYVPGTF